MYDHKTEYILRNSWMEDNYIESGGASLDDMLESNLATTPYASAHYYEPSAASGVQKQNSHSMSQKISATVPLDHVKIFWDQKLGDGKFGEVCMAEYRGAKCAAKRADPSKILMEANLLINTSLHPVP